MQLSDIINWAKGKSAQLQTKYPLTTSAVVIEFIDELLPKLEEALQTSSNNRSDEIAWLEKVASYPKSIGENFHVGIILKRLAQLRTMR